MPRLYQNNQGIYFRFNKKRIYLSDIKQWSKKALIAFYRSLIRKRKKQKRKARARKARELVKVPISSGPVSSAGPGIQAIRDHEKEKPQPIVHATVVPPPTVPPPLPIHHEPIGQIEADEIPQIEAPISRKDLREMRQEQQEYFHNLGKIALSLVKPTVQISEIPAPKQEQSFDVFGFPEDAMGFSSYRQHIPKSSPTAAAIPQAIPTSSFFPAAHVPPPQSSPGAHAPPPQSSPSSSSSSSSSSSLRSTTGYASSTTSTSSSSSLRSTTGYASSTTSSSSSSSAAKAPKKPLIVSPSRIRRIENLLEVLNKKIEEYSETNLNKLETIYNPKPKDKNGKQFNALKKKLGIFNIDREAGIKLLNKREVLAFLEELIEKTVPADLRYDIRAKYPALDERSGEGHSSTKGLYDDQINEIMSKYPEYLGTIARDEIKTILPKIQPQSRVAFIMNLDKHNLPGSHWVSVFADARPDGSQSIEYFDSYGREVPPDIQRDLKLVVDMLKPTTYLKFKNNKVVHQFDETNTCGFHAMSFLINRMRGKSFADVTGWDNTIKLNNADESEKKIDNQRKTGTFGFM